MAERKDYKRRQERQEQLREYLSKQQLAQNIVKRIGKMGDLGISGPSSEDVALARFELDKLKSQNSDALKLLNKFLPDERTLEITGDEDRPVAITSTTFVGVSDSFDDAED